MKVSAALLACCVACQPGSARPASSTVVKSCRYDVTLRANGSAHVQAHCLASGRMAFRAPEIVLRDLHGLPPARAGRFAAARGTLRYDVDVAKLATRARDIDYAARSGASFLVPLSNVLVAPEPLTTEIPVTVRVTPEAGISAAVGLTRGAEAGTYQLMAHEIPVATYVAFGKLELRRHEFQGGQLEIARLDGALQQPSDEVDRWIEKSAEAVRDFYGTFPVPRATLSVVPIPGKNSVVFGKVLPESEPGVALLIGEHAPREALYSDWILVHELFHLGFPSFLREGKWLDEGLATYYEPIIRVRAGLYTERELWQEWVDYMPQGLPAFANYGLEHASDFRGIYWGGAIACFVADVEARKRHPERGLEEGLRALRNAGGVASDVWTLAEVVTQVDSTLGAPTLGTVVEQHARRGNAFDLQAFFLALGVSQDAEGHVQFSDSAPLAAVRRAITAKP